MRISRPAATAAIVGAMALLGLSACGPFNRDQLQDGFTRSQPVSEVRIAESGSGDVTVLADDTVTGVDVRRSVRYLGSAPGDTIRVDGTTLVLTMDCGSQCTVSYEVHAPRGLKVTGENGSGNVKLRGVSDVDVKVGSGNVDVDGATGPVSLDVGSGDVTVASVTGSLTVQTGSGNVEGRGLSGATTVVTVGSGDVDLDVPGTGDVTVTSGSGNIDVRVPTNACKIEVATDSGDLNVNVATNPSSANELNLHTDSGDITVTPRG